MKIVKKSGNRILVSLLKSEVEAYFNRYHPFGYDTFILSEKEDEVIVSRMRFWISSLFLETNYA